MAARVLVLRRSVFGLIMIACLVGVSCSDRESPTAPGASSMGGKATISGMLLAEAAAGAPQPLAGITVRVASSGQTAQTDAAGNFTLAGVAPGAVGLDFRGAGVQASTTVSVSPGVIARITVTLNRGRGTVSLSPRSDGIEGTVDSINVAGMSFVLKTPGGMVTVQTDTGTVFRMRGSLVGFGDLKTGQSVEVEGSPAAGSLMARKVNIENVELEETRTATPTVTGTPPTATATRTPRPDDDDNRTRTPTVTGTPPTATPTKTPRPDDDDDRTKTPTPTPTAAVTGGSPSTPTPTRTPELEDETELEGTVGTTSGTSFMLMTRSGQVTIQTNSGTQFRHDGDPKSLADIKTGVEVQVQGARQPDGSVLASRVSLKGD
jgi:hypothetical protein